MNDVCVFWFVGLCARGFGVVILGLLRIPVLVLLFCQIVCFLCGRFEFGFDFARGWCVVGLLHFGGICGEFRCFYVCVLMGCVNVLMWELFGT